MDDKFRLRFAIGDVLYEAGEFDWNTRPTVVLLPDGRAVIMEYETGRDDPVGVMVVNVATATASEEPIGPYVPGSTDDELRKNTLRTIARTCPRCKYVLPIRRTCI